MKTSRASILSSLAVAAVATLLPVAAPAVSQAQTTSTTTPTTTPAQSSNVAHALKFRYCWSTSTFNPRCPEGGLLLWTDGTVQGRVGSTWVETPTSITVDVPNPSATVRRATYTGTRTSSTTQVCFTGTMEADNTAYGVMRGVWQGCYL